jgi:hypothetical protein
VRRLARSRGSAVLSRLGGVPSGGGRTWIVVKDLRPLRCWERMWM